MSCPWRTTTLSIRSLELTRNKSNDDRERAIALRCHPALVSIHRAGIASRARRLRRANPRSRLSASTHIRTLLALDRIEIAASHANSTATNHLQVPLCDGLKRNRECDRGLLTPAPRSALPSPSLPVVWRSHSSADIPWALQAVPRMDYAPKEPALPWLQATTLLLPKTDRCSLRDGEPEVPLFFALQVTGVKENGV